MNTSRHSHIFNYMSQEEHKIHIIGCGAVGSKVAIELTRLGCNNFVLWDEDIVSDVNLTNQSFFHKQIGSKKTEALASQMLAINPNIKVEQKGFFTEETADYINYSKCVVFSLPDTMKVRKLVFDKVKLNYCCIRLIETRIGLWDFMIYSINPMNSLEVSKYEETLYSDEEASVRETSPCGTPLTIGTLTSLVACMAVHNYMLCFNNDSPNEVIGSIHQRIFKDNFIQTLIKNYDYDNSNEDKFSF